MQDFVKTGLTHILLLLFIYPFWYFDFFLKGYFTVCVIFVYWTFIFTSKQKERKEEGEGEKEQAPVRRTQDPGMGAWNYNGMFVFSLVFTISCGIGLAISYATIDNSVKLKNDSLITAVYALSAMMIYDSVNFPESGKGFNTSCETYKNIAEKLMFYYKLDYMKSYYESHQFYAQEYMTMINCFFKQMMPRMVHDCFRKHLIKDHGFDTSKGECRRYCNSSRSLMPCIHDSTAIKTSQRVLECLKAASEFARWGRFYPQLYAEEINEKWSQKTRFFDIIVDNATQRAEIIEKCVLIDTRFKMYCNLGEIIFG
jgi:hypothetical protein